MHNSWKNVSLNINTCRIIDLLNIADSTETDIYFYILNSIILSLFFIHFNCFLSFFFLFWSTYIDIVAFDL